MVNFDDPIDWLVAAYRRRRADATAHDLDCQALIETLRDPEKMQQLVDQSSDGLMDPMLSPEFGDFHLIAQVGSGGMGQVFKATHKNLGRVQALKLLPPDRITNAQAMKRFEREMLAIGKLSHPAIVAVYDAGHIDGTPYLAMELVEGENLASLVRNTKRAGTKIQISDACRWIADAAEAVQHAHQNGVLHRDIKPANLMLNAQGQIKVLDLGLAKVSQTQSNPVDLHSLDSLTADHQILGTPDFMAPEQITGREDARSDIYSLAATLHFLLTGDVLFKTSKPGALSKAIAVTSQSPPLLSSLRGDIPPALEELVQKSLSKTPEDRPQTADDFATVLRTFTVEPTTKPKGLKNLTPTSSTTTDKESAHTRRGPFWPLSKWWLTLIPLFFGLLGILLVLRGPDGATLTIECDDPNMKVIAQWIGAENTSKDKETQKEINSGENAVLIAGPWRVQVAGDVEGRYELAEKEFVLKKGDAKTLIVTLTDAKKEPAAETAPNDLHGASAQPQPSTSQPMHSSSEIATAHYTPPTATQLASYSDIETRTGLLPREIIRPGLALEGLQLLSGVSTTHPSDSRAAPSVSPSGRCFAWLTRRGIFVKDLNTNKFLQFTPGSFRSFHWSSSDHDSNGDTISDQIIIVPKDLARLVELRSATGLLLEKFELSGWDEGQSWRGEADVIPIRNSGAFLVWGAEGAAVYDRNEKIYASVESEVFSKLFNGNIRACGQVGMFKTGDKSKPWAFLFTSNDEIVRKWQPEMTLDSPVHTVRRPTPIAKLNLASAPRSGEIDEWFQWTDGEKPVVPSFIRVAPNGQKILLSSNPYRSSNKERTIIINHEKKLVASISRMDRFAFSPDSQFLVDAQGKIYNDKFDEEFMDRRFADEVGRFPTLDRCKKTPFWIADSKVMLATYFGRDGAMLLECSLAGEIELKSCAPAASASSWQFNPSGDITVCALFNSTSRPYFDNRTYFANLSPKGKVRNIEKLNRIGAFSATGRSSENGNLLFQPHHHSFDLMSADGAKTITSFNNVSPARWSPTGKQFVVGTFKTKNNQTDQPDNWVFYSADGDEIQRVSRHPKSGWYPNPNQNRWSADDRFFVETARNSEDGASVIPVIHDLKTGRSITLAPHRKEAPIDFSPDSKWLSIRRRRPYGTPASPFMNLTVVNLETGEFTETSAPGGKPRRANIPFVFSPKTNQAILMDGIYQIGSTGDLKKIVNLSGFENDQWEFLTAVESDNSSKSTQESPDIKLLAHERFGRGAYAWFSLNKNRVLRPCNHFLNLNYYHFNQHNSKLAIRHEWVSGTLALLPIDSDEPTDFLQFFPDQSVLSFDEFGVVDSRGLNSDLNNYAIRTFNYPGGRVVPMNEKDYHTRLNASPEQKLQYWMQDLAIEHRVVDGKIVEVNASQIFELSNADLSFIEQLTDLEELTVLNCPNVTALMIPKRLDALTQLAVGTEASAELKVLFGKSVAKALPRCLNLERLDISGIEFPTLFVANIAECKNLKSLVASRELLTESVLKKLKTELPNCEVEIGD